MHFPFILLLASRQLSCSLTSVSSSQTSAVPFFLWTGATAAFKNTHLAGALLLLSCNKMQVPPGL